MTPKEQAIELADDIKTLREAGKNAEEFSKMIGGSPLHEAMAVLCRIVSDRLDVEAGLSGLALHIYKYMAPILEDHAEPNPDDYQRALKLYFMPADPALMFNQVASKIEEKSK